MSREQLISAQKIKDFRQLSNGTDEFLIEMLDKYIEVASSLLDKAREIHAAKDWEALKKTVHSLKGSTYSMGLDELGNFVLSFENELKGGTVESVIERLDHLEHYIKRVRDYRRSFETGS